MNMVFIYISEEEENFAASLQNSITNEKLVNERVSIWLFRERETPIDALNLRFFCIPSLP